MKPNFLWVGQGKSGSTLAYYVLKRNPEIFLGETKEHNFFTSPSKYLMGESYYNGKIAGYRGERYFGDISPGYYDRASRIDRIKEFYSSEPIPKIIFCLRNPSSFYISRYNQILKAGRFLSNPRELPGDINSVLGSHKFHLGETPILKKWKKVVSTLGGVNNICLLIYEEDFAGEYSFERRIYQFLGLNPLERYYNRRKDRWNSGVRPFFIPPEPVDRGVDVDGKRYRIPANQTVFCSTPVLAKILPSSFNLTKEKLWKTNYEWTLPLRKDLMSKIYEEEAVPLMDYVSKTFGRKISSWSEHFPQKNYDQGIPPVHLLEDE